MAPGTTRIRFWPDASIHTGAIPVIEHFDEHDELLAGLPVVRVTDWSTLTPERLQKEWTRIRRATHAGSLSWTKLYLPFWLHTFVAHIRPSDTGG